LTEAFNAGKETGMAEATAASAEKLTRLEASARGVLTDLQAQTKELLQRHEQQALSLALEIANKIIHFAVEINPEYLLPLVREALEHAAGARVRRVRLSPQDMEFIQVIGGASQIKDFDGTWEFVADPTIRTGCVVESSAGEIDFQLDRAWERVREQVVRYTEKV
jgi:flagellar biosynthesis/type III secretory pathway protein FliH